MYYLNGLAFLWYFNVSQWKNMCSKFNYIKITLIDIKTQIRLLNSKYNLT